MVCPPGAHLPRTTALAVGQRVALPFPDGLKYTERPEGQGQRRPGPLAAHCARAGAGKPGRRRPSAKRADSAFFTADGRPGGDCFLVAEPSVPDWPRWRLGKRQRGHTLARDATVSQAHPAGVVSAAGSHRGGRPPPPGFPLVARLETARACEYGPAGDREAPAGPLCCDERLAPQRLGRAATGDPCAFSPGSHPALTTPGLFLSPRALPRRDGQAAGAGD